MRIQKHHLLIAGLAVLCVAIWVPFLRQISPSRQRAERESFAALFLSRQLPSPITDAEAILDLADGRKRPLFPFHAGENVGPAELHQIDMQAQFLFAMVSARKTLSSGGWRQIGVAAVSGSNGAPVSVAVYQTPEHKFGFRSGGMNYAQDEPASDALWDYVLERQAE